MRVRKPKHSALISISSKNKEVYSKKFRYLNPANMIEIDVDIPEDLIKSKQNLEVTVDG